VWVAEGAATGGAERPRGARSSAGGMCTLQGMYPKEDLYATILGIRLPWEVTAVDLCEKDEEVHVTVSAQACGFRSRPRFRNAISFHGGGLYHATLSTHTNA
jgi:hypothetical protein